jgi:hypothetical protein
MMAVQFGRWRMSLEGIALIAACVLALVWLWPDAPTDEARDTAYRLANAYRQQRHLTAQAQGRTDTVTRIVIRQDGRLGAQSDSLTRAVAWADSVAEDARATNADLRLAVEVATSRATTFQTSALAMRDSVRDLIAAHALERLATNDALAAADSTIGAWQGAADAERKAGRRKFWRGVAIGAVLGVVVTGSVTLLAVAL